MVLYRRNPVPGGSYFFTVALFNRHKDWLVTHVDLLQDALRQTQRMQPFEIDAMVVLPDHLHAVWTLPPDDADFAQRWRAIKSRFSRALVKSGVSVRQSADGAYNIWQPRYWEHTIRDEQDLAHHVDYIHYNPVKHGHVTRVADWPHSSFHRYVRAGRLPADWGGVAVEDKSQRYGE
ncbi:MAG: transposase [Burkholderiales bacterium]|nr:transposase [Burkholderiales bacterium]MDP2399088.1 transposase [Burkholderiales bacterium]MDP3715306.1 transposase [Burkholderiales bacterium]